MGNCVSSVFDYFHSSFLSMRNPPTSMQQDHPENAFDGIAAQACPSSSTSTKKGPCDVFINHRGCDVKHKLASTIYHTLDLLGLRAFLDENELDLGDSIPDEIQEAMRSAGLHIAIFSQRYAESAWCLAELAFMVKSGTKILPVFYHVEPDDLRWVGKAKGCYAHAFSQHEKKGRYSSTMLDDWKIALQKVSYLSGYMLHTHNDDEGKLLKSIVNSVLATMKKVPLEVAKHPVAMDEIVEDFERSQGKCIQSEQQVQIVGIVGFGGSGKTTLATELYNRKSSSFNRSSFLHDVRDAASKNALHAKQKKLLEDLHIQTKSFDNLKEGKAIVADRLESLCVLIVLDDVDGEDQVDALLPPKESLGLGSLVIITTRERRVLRKCGITSIYTMQPLQPFHAKQLFCWHAFLQVSPPEGFDELVKSFLGVCSGLPLSLKVIGGQLYGRKSTEYWYAQLDKIRKMLPEDIKAILKVSFDALDRDEQNVFLDIACFFIGEETRLGIPVWDGSGWSGVCSLETLLNKCLVEVDEDGRMRMHDHLRDLGRDIATTTSPSRFWFQRRMDIQRGIPIRGIMATTRERIFTYLTQEFGQLSRNLLRHQRFYFEHLDTTPPLKEYMEMMRISNRRAGLQLLVVEENGFTQECGELSRDLLWLRWFSFQHKDIPPWLSMHNIRVLQFLYAPKLEALWYDEHPPLQLRELLIENADKLESLPRSIEHLKHLKRLSIIDNWGLCSLPEEFCRLQSLEHLVLSGCRMLSSLPNHFGDLLNLRHLNLKWCRSLNMLPESFKQLRHLEYLNLSECRELTLESDILENIANIKVFDVSNCTKIETLPHSITNQASLVKLNLSNTRGLRELPASIGQLSRLEELIINRLSLLTTLPISLGNLSSLVTLTLDNCRELYEMPSLAGLVSLNNLYVKDCHKIEKIEGLENLTSLRNLHVWTLWKVPGMHSLRCAERMRSLNLRADSVSAFEACIQSIEMEKWPREMTIWGRIFPDVQSILDLYTFPGLVVEKPLNFSESRYSCLRWDLTCRETKLPHAAIVCYLVVVNTPREYLEYLVDNTPLEFLEYEIGIRERESTRVIVSEGKWIVISVLTEVSSLMEDGGHCLKVTRNGMLLKVYDEWVIVGERSRLIEGFKQLFQILCTAASIT